MRAPKRWRRRRSLSARGELPLDLAIAVCCTDMAVIWVTLVRRTFTEEVLASWPAEGSYVWPTQTRSRALSGPSIPNGTMRPVS